MKSIKELAEEFKPLRPIPIPRTPCCDAPWQSGHHGGRPAKVCSACKKPAQKNAKPRDSS